MSKVRQMQQIFENKRADWPVWEISKDTSIALNTNSRNLKAPH